MKGGWGAMGRWGGLDWVQMSGLRLQIRCRIGAAGWGAGMGNNGNLRDPGEGVVAEGELDDEAGSVHRTQQFLLTPLEHLVVRRRVGAAVARAAEAASWGGAGEVAARANAGRTAGRARLEIMRDHARVGASSTGATSLSRSSLSSSTPATSTVTHEPGISMMGVCSGGGKFGSRIATDGADHSPWARERNARTRART